MESKNMAYIETEYLEKLIREAQTLETLRQIAKADKYLDRKILGAVIGVEFKE